jgi:3-polyprenyl-4-hydroxybenzoate decarboxylase
MKNRRRLVLCARERPRFVMLTTATAAIREAGLVQHDPHSNALSPESVRQEKL